MQRPLTILLPVRNVQSLLADRVSRVLDTAADLSDRFQVLIIDDASTDGTGEVAHELSLRYPQIRVLRHTKPLGEDVIVRLAAVQIRGEVLRVRGGQHVLFEPVFSHDENDSSPLFASQTDMSRPLKTGKVPPKTPPVRPNFLDRASTAPRDNVRQ